MVPYTSPKFSDMGLNSSNARESRRRVSCKAASRNDCSFVEGACEGAILVACYRSSMGCAAANMCLYKVQFNGGRSISSSNSSKFILKRDCWSKALSVE